MTTCCAAGHTSAALYRTPTEQCRSATPIRLRRAALLCARYCVGMTVSRGFPVDFDLRVVKHGPGARVVTVVGQVDGPTGLELAHSLIEQLAVARVVIVDLDGVQLLGSGGMSALFEANELASDEGRALRLVCHSRIANWALEAAGLRECFTFADSVTEALENPLPVSNPVTRRLYRHRSRRSLQRDNTVYQSRSNTAWTSNTRDSESTGHGGRFQEMISAVASRTALSVRVIRSGRS
jgi:anti-sigma B factor antagonist